MPYHERALSYLIWNSIFRINKHIIYIKWMTTIDKTLYYYSSRVRPEVTILGADQKERGPWGWKWQELEFWDSSFWVEWHRTLLHMWQKKRADSGGQIAHTYVPIKAYTYLVRRSLRQATLNLPQKTGTDHRGACGRQEEAKSTSLWLPKKQEPTRTWNNDFDIKNTRSETHNFETFSQTDFCRVWNYTFNKESDLTTRPFSTVGLLQFGH